MTSPLTGNASEPPADDDAGGHLGADLRGSTLSTSPDERGGAEGPPVLLLTIKQAAGRLAVGRCTMQQMVLTGEVRSLKIGKLRRIPPEALDEYIARKMQP